MDSNNSDSQLIIAGAIIFSILSILILIFLPKIQTKKIDDLEKRIELSNKIRTTLAQILGGAILLATFWTSFLNIQVTNQSVSAARESARIDRDIANRQFEQTLANSEADRANTASQLKVQREQIEQQTKADIDQRNSVLFNQAIDKLIASESEGDSQDELKKISAINILEKIAVGDLSGEYLEIIVPILVNFIKTNNDSPHSVFSAEYQAAMISLSKLRSNYGRPIKLNRVQFNNAELSYITLNNFEFDNCSFNNFSFIKSEINYSHFQNCWFYISDFVNSSLSGVEFINSEIRDTGFKNTTVSNSNLHKSDRWYTLYELQYFENGFVTLDTLGTRKALEVGDKISTSWRWKKEELYLNILGHYTIELESPYSKYYFLDDVKYSEIRNQIKSLVLQRGPMFKNSDYRLKLTGYEIASSHKKE